MTIITRDQIISELEKVVEESGAEHTAHCRYQEDGQPVCIAGKVLYNLGTTIEQLDAMDDGVGSLVSIEPTLLHEITGLSLDEDAYWTLQTAQSIQDGHETWGKALEAAKEYNS